MKKPLIISTNQAVKHVNVLVYGDSGIGKTRLSSTAPSPIILSAESGLMSLQGYDLPVIEVKTRSDVDDIYDWLKGSKEAKQYETVCLDSLSEIGEVLLDAEMKVNKDGRAAYGVMASELSVLIRGFRDLPIHSYFAAKNKKVVAETSGAITYMPSVPGQKLLNDLPYFFDEVFRMNFYTYEKKKYRVLETVGGRNFVAKDRSGRLAEKEAPDLTQIFNTILAKDNT